ncbi:MAG TPA: PAS domain-containing protein [Acidobacteriaceae bacterium]
MLREDQGKPVSETVMERWPWALRAFLGCCAAIFAVVLNYSVAPLRNFPLLLAFPTVILACWFLGMWGGVVCAVSEALLIDRLLAASQMQFFGGPIREDVRLALFLLVSILLGWAVRRLAQQKALLETHELRQRLTDATVERKVAEERARISEELRDRDEVLQLALRSNGMGLWVWDIHRSEIYWSDEVYRIVGLEPRSVKPSLDTWLQSVHSDDAERVSQAVQQSQRVGTDYHQQYRVRLPDGTMRWVESKGKGQRDVITGKATRVVGVLADITTRKQNEEAMLRAEKLAVAGRLAASVAHEINNPLEAVANLLYLITFSETATAAQEWGQQALDELMRVSLITQQTLKFHRQAGAPQTTKLSEVIQAIMALFRGRMRSAQIDVQLRVKGEANIECMPGEVQQIFANLISNAIDAMPRGGRLVIRIRPSHDWRDRKTSGMRVTLCDTGTGMDRSTMLRMFEPFFTTKAETGTGLGMWVVAQLVERHRGQVRVWSTQGADSGSTAITVFLPLVDRAKPTAAGRLP